MSFSCELNNDVESFLRKKAINNEKRHISRTYIVMDDAPDAEIPLLAYFSVTFKEILINRTHKLSKTKFKKLAGKRPLNLTDFDGLRNRFPAFLIGQIGKNDGVTDKAININFLLSEITGILRSAQQCIGGRFVFLECENTPKLVELYKKAGFDYLQTDIKNQVVMYAILDTEDEVPA